MPNYSLGKIYVIKSKNEEDGLRYIGSTTLPLKDRYQLHQSDFRGWKAKTERSMRHNISSSQVFEKYGLENCHIVLIEAIDASSRKDLLMNEQHYIDMFECVNVQRAHTSPDHVISPKKVKLLEREVKNDSIHIDNIDSILSY